MRRLRAVIVGFFCVFLGACEEPSDFSPQPASDEMVRRLEARLAPGIQVGEVYMHPLGETDDPIFQPDGLIVAGLMQGGRYDGEVVVAYIEPDGGRFASLLTGSDRIDAAPARRTYGEYATARALVKYVKEQR